MKTILLNILIFLTVLINYNCNTTEPPVPPPPEQPKAVTLNLIETTCTEAFIKINAADTVLPVNISLNRDENPIFNFTLTKPDTIIIDENLLPHKTYVYQTRSTIIGKEEIGDTLQVKTLDTTSHNFSWQSFYFGDFASSILYDVAIIDENNIYAVGTIYLNDSTGQPDLQPYNLAKWNGLEWKFERIMFPLCDENGNQNGSGPFKATSIFALSLDNIWIICDVSMVHWNGQIFQSVCMPLGYGQRNLTKIFGLNNNLYLIGTNGFIAFYQNGIWQKIESGTDLNINDIWGDYDERTNELEILTVGGNILQGTERIILRITNDNKIQQISPEGTINYPLGSVWFSNNLKHYVGGAGLYTKYYNESNWEEIQLPQYYTYSIKGNGTNDIIVCG